MNYTPIKIYCCGCSKEVVARLTNGEEIYPHRTDLHSLPFWKCDKCEQFVGCHYKTKDRTKPLGCIPNAEIKNARREIHKLIDPAWRNGPFTRKEIYRHLTKELGKKYHTAEIRTIKEAREVWRLAHQFINHERPNEIHI